MTLDMMQDDDFNTTNFGGFTLEEQLRKCHVMAAEAESFAAENAEHRETYLELAAQWSQLAEEMKRVLQSREAARVN